MQRMAYGDAETMVNESLVRAAVIVYFQQNGEESRKNLKRIREEQRNGFFWMDQLVDKLKQYEAHRAQYPTFSSYVPQVGLFYRELAPHASEDARLFGGKSAHVVSIEPFAIPRSRGTFRRTITIVVNMPLDPSAGFSINLGMEPIIAR